MANHRSKGSNITSKQKVHSLPRKFFDKNDLYIAYRKAKFDLYRENYQPKKFEIACYESKLDLNLKNLYNLLKNEAWGEDESLAIKKVWTPKGIDLPSVGSIPLLTNDGFAEWENYFSDPKREAPSVEFKPISDAPIDLHIISALWIGKIGERFDSLLPDNVYGSRIARQGRRRKYNVNSVSSFVHYPTAYRNWRRRGIGSIRNAVEQGTDVVAVTMDFSDFFGSIDPRFIVKPEFEALLSSHFSRYVPLTESELQFSANLVNVLLRYRRGLPIGLSASAVIANMVLFQFDFQIISTLSPIYYGRYMDDLFLVLQNTDRLVNSQDLTSHIRQKFNATAGIVFAGDELKDRLVLDKKIYGRTQLSFNRAKQRHFIVSRHAGHDILDILEEKLEEISSERRRLPDKSITMSASARALSISNGFGEEVDFTGKADRVIIRRLGLANIVGAFFQFAKQFQPHEWEKERAWLLRLSLDHVMPPHRFFPLAKYVPRIVSIFVAAGDWEHAVKVLLAMKRTLHYAVQEKLGEQFKGKFQSFYDFMCRWVIEEAVSAMPFTWHAGTVKILRNAERELARFPGILRSRLPSKDSVLPRLEGLCLNLQKNFLLLYWSDMSHAAPADELSKNDWQSDRVLALSSRAAFGALGTRIIGYQEGFRQLFSKSSSSIPMPPNFMLFPTRRMSQIEICRQNPDVVLDVGAWRNVNRFARGTNWIPGKSSHGRRDGNGVRRLDDKTSVSEVLVAVVNVSTSDLDWSKSLTAPNDGRDRYERLVPTINAIIEAVPRPEYVIFPELSIPARLADTFGQRLAQSGISSIMGVEYDVSFKDGEGGGGPPRIVVRNSVHLYLVDKTLGYSSVIFQREDKGSPAIHEREELRGAHNAALNSEQGRSVPIYRHNGLCLAVLICSELTNVKYRAHLAGAVDLLVVPSWNQDITTFSSLVESASLDLHCFVAVANNRRFGDSRIRGPYKEPYLRDVARLQGGIHDLFITGKLPVEELRRFQAHYISPKMPFKPVPDGFIQQEWRKGRPWPKGT